MQRVHGESDPALQRLESLVDSTVLDAAAHLHSRMIRERGQYLSQLRPLRDESLDQLRPRQDEQWSQSVTTALLLHFVVVGLRSGLCRYHCAQLAGDDVSVEHDAGQGSGVVFVLQELLGFCFLRPSTPVSPLPALALASIPKASFATPVCV